MKREDLKKIFGEALTKEQEDAVMALNGSNIEAAKASMKDLQSQLDDEKRKIAEYEKTIKELKDAGEDTKEWKSKFEKLEKELQKRDAAEQAAAADKALTAKIEAAIGDKKFVNDYTRNAVIEKIKAASKEEENLHKGFDVILNEITKDQEGIFENPQDKSIIPPAGGGSSNPQSQDEDARIDAIMGITRKE